MNLSGFILSAFIVPLGLSSANGETLVGGG